MENNSIFHQIYEADFVPFSEKIFDPQKRAELEAIRINPMMQYPEPEVLLSSYESPLFTRGDLSIIIGLPGCRKTFLCSLLIASYLEGTSAYSDGRFVTKQNPGRVLWIDTEQGNYRCAKLFKRLNNMVDFNDERLIMLSMREMTCDDRLRATEDAIQCYEPDIVLIDGLADLMSDPNSIQESLRIQDLIMAWCSNYRCHIINVIHANYESDKARGHLGSNMCRKASLVLMVKSAGIFSTVSATKSRDVRPADFRFFVNAHGVPQIDNNEIPEPSEKTATSKKDKLAETFKAIMKPGQKITFSELGKLVAQYRQNTISMSTARNMVLSARDEGILEKDNTGYFLKGSVQQTAELPLDGN